MKIITLKHKTKPKSAHRLAKNRHPHDAITNRAYQEQIFCNNEQHFKTLLHDIHQANYVIYLETYMFHRDTLGEQVLNALVAAAKRGVMVRVMVDGAGSPLWAAQCARILENVGARTKVFHPFPWQLWNWSRSVVKIHWLLRGIYLLLKINSRNHRKICLIDNRIAYIGSQNICKYHLPQTAGGEGWRDTSVRLIGMSFADLKQAFEVAWEHRTIKERLRDTFKQIRQNPRIRLNYTRHRRRILYKHLLRRIRQCRERVWITNAYFVPDNFLLKRLQEAASQGKDVRILLPKKSDIWMLPWTSATFYYNLLKAGVRIFEYLPNVLHAKTLIVDDWVLVGSSNLNHRSLLHDLEVDIAITTPQAKQAVSEQFLHDIEQAREINLQDANHRPWWQRLIGRLVLYVKYWV